MKKWLDDDNILMYMTHNEGKSVATERFVKTLKGKIYKKMTPDDSKYYIGYFSKLVDEYNNTCYHSVSKKAIDTDCSALAKEIERNSKAPQFKVIDKVRITK